MGQHPEAPFDDRVVHLIGHVLRSAAVFDGDTHVVAHHGAGRGGRGTRLREGRGAVARRLGDARLHPRRAHDADSDAAVGGDREVVVKALAQRDHGVLRGEVGRHPRAVDEACERRDVDDVACALGDHLRNEGTNPMHHAPEIDSHAPVPLAERDLPGEAPRADPGVVAENMGRPERVVGPASERRHVVGIRDVRSHRDGGAALLRERVTRANEGLFFDVGQNQLHSGSRKARGHGAPDPAGGACDDGYAALQFSHRDWSFPAATLRL